MPPPPLYQYRGTSRSVPSSPTAKSASKRSSSTLPSPRKSSASTPTSSSVPPSPGSLMSPSLASVSSLFPSVTPPTPSCSSLSTSPKYHANEKHRQSSSFIPSAYRSLAWVSVILLFNYLGYTHPILWSPSERSALVSYLTGNGFDKSAIRHDWDPYSAAGDYDPTGDTTSMASFVEPSKRGRILAQQVQSVNLAEPDGRDTDTEQAANAETISAANGTSTVVEATGGSTIDYENPYTTPWPVDVPNQKSCKKVYPRHLVKASGGPITYVGDLVRKRQRLLLSIPRHGLGNSLRGYVSSFIYASVSGRRLVRFHGAEHAKVYDTLCHAFNCGLESISGDDNDGGAMGLFKQLEMLNPVDLNSKFKTSSQVVLSFRATHGLFVSKSPHFFDGFWQHYPSVKSCVYDAFGCSSTWCVHSRAIQALLGKPTPLLESVIAKVLKRHTGNTENKEGGEIQEVPAEWGSGDMFDLALHLRTRPASLESKNPLTGEEGKQALMKIGCGLQESGDASQYLKSCLWDCLEGLLKDVEDKRKDKGQRPMRILLATDNEQLRPAFVARLAPFGTVYYSSGVIVHSSKSASDEAERLPTMAEFHLMSRSHMILEAGSYISTFAYFSGLLGNGTLAGISWQKNGGCGLRLVHKGELMQKS